MCWMLVVVDVGDERNGDGDGDERMREVVAAVYSSGHSCNHSYSDKCYYYYYYCYCCL